MRTLPLTLLLSLAATFSSFSANAYVIHNNTGVIAYFKAKNSSIWVCFDCYEGWINNGDTGACPGNMDGCNEDMKITIKGVGKGYTWSYFGMPADQSQASACITSPVAVTRRGDVYAYKDHVEVRDDKDNLLYNGPWTWINCNSGSQPIDNIIQP
jgi:hypothetical protein